MRLAAASWHAACDRVTSVSPWGDAGVTRNRTDEQLRSLRVAERGAVVDRYIRCRSTDGTGRWMMGVASDDQHGRGRSAATFRRSGAPGSPPSIPCAGEALGDELVAERPAVARQDAESPPVAVDFPVDGAQLERSGVHQLREAQGRPLAELGLALATRRMGLGRVDVRDPDLVAIHAVSPSTTQLVPPPVRQIWKRPPTRSAPVGRAVAVVSSGTDAPGRATPTTPPTMAAARSTAATKVRAMLHRRTASPTRPLMTLGSMPMLARCSCYVLRRVFADEANRD